MNGLKSIAAISFLSLTLNANALVDYSGGPSATKYDPTTTSPAPVVRQSRAKTSAPASSGFDWGFLPQAVDFSLGYTSAKAFYTDENINMLNMKIKGTFSHGIFVELGMNGAQSLETSEYEQGNSSAKLGFNWLDIGNDYNKLIFDIFVGTNFSGKSEFSTKRSDRFVGVTTEKRFGAAALGLTYERTFTEGLVDDEEMSIGDISQWSADLGIMVSSEIQFLLTYGEVKVGASDFLSANYLSSDLKYSYIKPQMFLKMANAVRLNLGAVFQASRPDSSLMSSSLKIWGLPAAYGNTLFAGLNIAI
ncbi:hypothetical protein BALOs_1445 [Halobacteriovorax sp. BALOs_7]|uniref:hypothetical protein n=1 Tax=unclassified Halobacteriovorax TaxID=2639665 RepID=UPI000EA2A994|nr:hypothetical protein [Halobacteriovorax sp. BALOs_7]AYF44446.1 hypothetical protein BALOs_1445 [Halobacteriovorax sp. BALOs_7]